MQNSRSARSGTFELTGRPSAPASDLPADSNASTAAPDLSIATKRLTAIRDKLLDEALEGTFPASDPIASMNFTR
jgi:hypothetical protein